MIERKFEAKDFELKTQAFRALFLFANIFRGFSMPYGRRIARLCGGVAFCVLMLCVHAAGAVLYVNSSAPAGGNGSSWSSAFQSVQKAVNAASSGSQIWVAAGTYHDPVVSNNTNLQMQDGVSL